MSLLQQILNAAVLGSTYVLMAVGLAMVYGVLKVLHIAHAAVYTIGALVGLVAFAWVGSFWVALPVAMLASGFAGVAIYRGVYYYMLDSPRTVPLLASIGLFVMSTDLMEKEALIGPYPKAYPLGESGMPFIGTELFSVAPKQGLVLAVTTISLVVVYLILTRTRLGLGWRAAALDRDMAGSVGVNLDWVVALNFFVGSALAGAAGVLVAYYNNSISATMGDLVSYKAFIIIVLGGVGSLPGAIIASLVLAAVENGLVASIGYVLPRDAIAFLVLILVLMFRPRGLLGQE